MVLLQPKSNNISDMNKSDFSKIKFLYPNSATKIKEEIVYRKDGRSVEKLIEFDTVTGHKTRTTYYDYFNDKKIRSIDEYDMDTGKKIRTTNFVLYKSVDEYDIKTGAKIRTINFNIKDESKISSIQEYDVASGEITTIIIYKRDGKTIGIIKNIDPETGKITNWINKNNDFQIANISKYTRSYDNIKQSNEKEDIANLIDNLYKNNMKFENI